MLAPILFAPGVRNGRGHDPRSMRPPSQSSPSHAVLFVLAAAWASGCLFTLPAAAHDDVMQLPARLSANRVVDVAGIGNYRMAVTTSSALARHYFEQGIILAWGFNFAEAVRSFREATRQDKNCALCYWGVAYALGPSINHDMNPQEAAGAYEAVTRATALAAGTTALERALISALAARYSRDPRAEREPLDRAYAEAMRALANAQPHNADVLTLAAEAEMDLHPHDLWQADGTAQPWTPGVLARLEQALALAPGNPGANHYFVHALEDSPEPQRALPAAERLMDLAPGLGHLVHMPAHIFFRLGRYHETTLANQRAIAADSVYLRAAYGRASLAYVNGYVLHNVHFLWTSAVLEGASRIATEVASRLASGVDAASLASARSGTAQHFLALPLYTYVLFGEWAAIRAAPSPPATAPYAIGVWHYARGIAAARNDDVRAARAELSALEALARRPALARSEVKFTNSHAALLSVAAALLRAEIAAADGDLASAIDEARSAVASEDGFVRDEPPIAVAFLARHRLGALLLAAGRPNEAESVYRTDLDHFPENGYGLAGLAASLRDQGHMTQAEEVDGRITSARAHADTAIPRWPSASKIKE